MEPHYRDQNLQEIFSSQTKKMMANIQAMHFVAKGIKGLDFDKSHATIPTAVILESGGQVFSPPTQTQLIFTYLRNHWPTILITAVLVGAGTLIICKIQEKNRAEENKKNNWRNHS